MLQVLLLLASANLCSGLWFLTHKHCYDRIGCFTNRAPFNNALGSIPQSPRDIAPGFLLHTRTNPVAEQVLHSLSRKSLTNSNFDPSRKTKVIIHGFTQNGRVAWVKEMTSAILLKDDVNVIAVDWVHGSVKLNYAQAAANTRVVGALIAELIQTLHDVTGAPLASFHLIGHSLGAHVAGYAGERIHKLGRITGLDPAGPLFWDTDVRVRLDPDDAQFVDVIHTDGNRVGGLGLFKACGTADFYPNGGKHQTGCGLEGAKRAFHVLTKLKFEKFSDVIACDHMRAIDLFTSSIHNPCEECACPAAHPFAFGPGCQERCAVMGYNLDTSRARGVFYSTTEDVTPYCDVEKEEH